MAPRIRNSAYVLNLIPRESSYRFSASSRPTTPELTRSSVSMWGGMRSFRRAAWMRMLGRNSLTIASRSGLRDFRGDAFRILSLETAACPCIMAFALVYWGP